MRAILDRFHSLRWALVNRFAPPLARFRRTLDAMTPRDRMLLIGLVTVLTLVVVGLGTAAMARKLRNLDQQLQTRESQARMVNEMQGSYADASEQLTELEGKVNAYKATKLSAFLEQCADRVQIRDNLKQVKERSVTTTESLEEKQYTVQLSRVTVEQFANFLYEAETTGFPMTIKSTKVKTTLAAGQKLLEVTFEISAYRLIEEEQEATG